VSAKDPKIRFAGREIPTHQVWAKLEIANQVLDVMDRYNEKRPDLASDHTREVAQEVRKRLAGIEIFVPPRPEKNLDLEDQARVLLKNHTPEEVIDIFKREHNLDYNLQGIIYLAGEEAYLNSLVNEAHLLRNNAISWDQMAQLWNEAKRPVPGKPFWDARTVEMVVRGAS
jgi:hypothetical protein